MRYYLAIECYLGALSLPAPAAPGGKPARLVRGRRALSTPVARMESADYLAMKRREYSRQRGG
jgi:hypothetical protein